MHLDVGTVIWLIVVAFGVISSVVSNARKAAQRSQIAPPQSSRVPVHEQAFAPAPEMPQPMAIPIPIAPQPAPIVITKRKPAPAQKQPEDSADKAFASFQRVGDGTRRFRGMFDRANLASAFVASQVFGPPKALQEQSIWSPRHNEPSI